MKRLKILVLVTMCVMPLIGCSTNIIANDDFNQCKQCVKPIKPYTDSDIAEYLICQHERVNTCRALLGHKDTL